MNRRRALAELVFAGALWGFGFVATVWALTAHTPAELVILRYALAVAAGELIWWLTLRGNPAPAGHWKLDFKLAWPAGLLLAGMVLPQTVGLQSTSASKSGFLTTFYVALVPLLNRLIFRTAVGARRIAYAVMALAGAFLMMGAIGDVASMNPGDLWTLLCAVMAAFHIIYIERISSRIGDAFRFNNFQSAFCLLAVTPALLTQPSVSLTGGTLLSWAGLLSLALGSSVVAFTIQVRTQRILPSATAAMLFLLESPFALLFGFLLLGETLTPAQGAGAGLILLAALLTARAG